jgi:quercetin dioxygenase-like cupin family protein
MSHYTALPAIWANSLPGESGLLREFSRDGFIGPISLYNQPECETIHAHVREQFHPAPLDWIKGRAATDRFIYDLAVSPKLLGPLTELLGPNLILWGASVVKREPGSCHPWHTDIESSAAVGAFASVWVGIKNTNQDSSLQLIPGSHRYGKPLQQVAQEQGHSRGVSPSVVLSWARARDQLAKIVQLDIADGEAVLFDGRLWHGSHNCSNHERVALLLQYSAADMPIRIPDPEQLEWPFRNRLFPLPPVILVAGSVKNSINRLVTPPPKKGSRPMITSWIHPLKLPLSQDAEKGWKPHPIFRGPTRILDLMGIHASILDPGCSPHLPHIHPEEELLMVLDGEAEIVLADDPAGTNMRVELGRPGKIFYYPPHQHHTIRNSASRPVTYLMLKWRAGLSAALDQLGTSIFVYGAGMMPDERKGYKTGIIFQQPTAYLNKLHAHLTTMLPGSGYEPHVDAYDVAILILSGKLETLGQVVEPHSVIFYSAGESHGMKNIGQEPARYLVFEFHGTASSHVLDGVREKKLEAKSALEELGVTRSKLKASRAHAKKLEDTLLRQSSDFEKKLEVKRSELKASRAQAKKLEAELVRSHTQTGKLEAKLAAVCESRSWWITGPLRVVFNFVRRKNPR